MSRRLVSCREGRLKSSNACRRVAVHLVASIIIDGTLSSVSMAGISIPFHYSSIESHGNVIDEVYLL
jgi:hypothetical protein